MGWIFGKSKKKKEEDKKQINVVKTYENDFKALAKTENRGDDRADKNVFKMSEEEIKNTRFYGARFQRALVTSELQNNINPLCQLNF